MVRLVYGKTSHLKSAASLTLPVPTQSQDIVSLRAQHLRRNIQSLIRTVEHNPMRRTR